MPDLINHSNEASASFSLNGKVTVVTGAGSGMGRASALAFAGAGATVYALDLDEEALSATTEAANEAPGNVLPVPGDITDDSGLDALIDRIQQEHGRIDVLFNHAGRACAPGLDLNNDDWIKASDLNLRVPVILTSKALPLLRQSEAASLIYTASIAGLVASPNSPLYSAVKSGVIGFSRAVAVALGPEGIRANTICPGTMETPMLVDFFRRTAADPAAATREDVEAGVGKFAEQVPLGRTGQPHEVAALALFLASDASCYINGTVIPVDGGYVAR